jgi:hypothetical protein
MVVFQSTATSQQYFSQNKPVTTNQLAVLFSQNKSASATNHQPNKPTPKHQAAEAFGEFTWPVCVYWLLSAGY